MRGSSNHIDPKYGGPRDQVLADVGRGGGGGGNDVRVGERSNAAAGQLSRHGHPQRHPNSEGGLRPQRRPLPGAHSLGLRPLRPKVLVHALLTTGSGRRIVATLFRHFSMRKPGRTMLQRLAAALTRSCDAETVIAKSRFFA
jgi:hypothetical protein